MEDIYLGRVITTHGIKGELRIKSTFPYKEKAFKIENKFHFHYNDNYFCIHTTLHI